MLLCDPPKAPSGAEGEYMSLRDLAPRVDVLTLHTPLTRDGSHPTFHMIDREILSLMRPGAVLVNAARGPVVDSAAVAEKALSGSLRLVTDVWEGEPADLNPVILEKSEVATPHIAGYSLQGKQRATRMIIESVGRTFGIPVARREGEPGVKVWDLPAPYTPWPQVTAPRHKGKLRPPGRDSEAESRPCLLRDLERQLRLSPRAIPLTHSPDEQLFCSYQIIDGLQLGRHGTRCSRLAVTIFLSTVAPGASLHWLSTRYGIHIR